MSVRGHTSSPVRLADVTDVEGPELLVASAAVFFPSFARDAGSDAAPAGRGVCPRSDRRRKAASRGGLCLSGSRRHRAPRGAFCRASSDLISIGRDPPTPALACRQCKRSCRRRDRVFSLCSRVYERVSRRIWGAPPVTAKGRAPAILLIGSGRALPRHPLAIPTLGRDPSCSLPRTCVRAVAGPMKPLRTSETSRPGAPPGGGAHVGQYRDTPSRILLNLQLRRRMAGPRQTRG